MAKIRSAARLLTWFLDVASLAFTHHDARHMGEATRLRPRGSKAFRTKSTPFGKHHRQQEINRELSPIPKYWRFTRHYRSVLRASVASSAETIRSQDPRHAYPILRPLLHGNATDIRRRLRSRLVGQFDQPSLRLFGHRNRLQSGGGRTCHAGRGGTRPVDRIPGRGFILVRAMQTLRSWRALLGCFTTRTTVWRPFAVYVNLFSREVAYLSASTTNTAAGPSLHTFTICVSEATAEEAMLARYKELHSGLR